MPKRYTMKDLRASDTDPVLRAEMIAAGVLNECRDDPELSVYHSLLFPVDELLLPSGFHFVDGGSEYE